MNTAPTRANDWTETSAAKNAASNKLIRIIPCVHRLINQGAARDETKQIKEKNEANTTKRLKRRHRESELQLDLDKAISAQKTPIGILKNERAV